MIVTAGSLTRYEVLTRPGESSGKVCAAPHTAGTIRYNRSSTSGWRSRNRHPCSQSTRSRGWLMQGSNRIVKTRSRAVCSGSGICSASGCPAGTFDNRSAIHKLSREHIMISPSRSCLPPTLVGGQRPGTLFLEPASAGLREELRSPAKAGSRVGCRSSNHQLKLVANRNICLCVSRWRATGPVAGVPLAAMPTGHIGGERCS